MKQLCNISENKLVNKFKAKIEVWSKKKPKLLLTKGFDFEKLKIRIFSQAVLFKMDSK